LLCGHTTVGDDNYMGIRATTVPEISIGDRNKIQAGMILDKNVGDDSTVFYRYKEKLLAIPQ
jgi:bifunctional N-acetylglucosamine-1-phosphate-uridyltransferase/glucosamine-1-phosphate-acetyltransferase GlmU-like protein